MRTPIALLMIGYGLGSAVVSLLSLGWSWPMVATLDNVDAFARQAFYGVCWNTMGWVLWAFRPKETT
jgi:hypothetical protein